MNAAVEIMKRAGLLFDVAAVSLLPDASKLLILGLESTVERNLDDFGHIGEEFRMYGFEKHVVPRLKSLLRFVSAKGFAAEPIGKYGYPLKGEVHLKREAVRTGLGRWGKSMIVLHPEYGPRLRFIAVRTDAPLQPLASLAERREN